MHARIATPLFPCVIALLLGACGAREAAPSEVDPASAPLETAAEPRPDSVPAQAPAGKRAPGQQAEPLLAYRAIGTEPFWAVRTEGDRLHFTTPEDQAGRQFTGTHASHADGVRYVGDDDGTPFELDIRRGQCSDGMSDLVYAFEATFRYGATTYQGCAEQAKAR